MLSQLRRLPIALKLQISCLSIKMPIKISHEEKKLDEKEKLELDKLVNEYYEKIKRELGEDFLLDMQVKVYSKCEKEGKCGKKKYSLNVKVENSIVIKSNAYDWNLAKAVHKALNKIMSEIEHKFHVSEQNKRR